MKVYEYHEIANIFPMMQDDEYERLKDDIAINGQLEPIVLYEGKVLDGRNRYKALCDIGLKTDFEEYQGDQPGNWYTSVAHYWFVGYAYKYPVISFDRWILIDLPCLKRLDHQQSLNWVIKSNNEPGYKHISFRYIEFGDIPSAAVIARF